MLSAIIICGASVFTSCSKEDNPVTPDLNVAEKIIGKWITAESDGKALPTNEKIVFDIVSPTEAYVSLSIQDRTAEDTPWRDREEVDVEIIGNDVILSHSPKPGMTVMVELYIDSITDATLIAKRTVTIRQDGGLVKSTENMIRYEKLDKDYSADIVGIWEGQISSEQDTYGDGLQHRWEYKADGTYVYYVKDGDNWVPSANTLNEYFVAGKLLCMRWVNAGTELREWWEIESIENGVMKWKALRQREDGTTYTATFEMKKVEVPSQAEVEQKIIGKWMNAELAGQPVPTNQKLVMNFISSTEAYISASFNDHPETGDGWYDLVESDVAINGNKMTMANPEDQYAKVVSEFTISAINDKEFTAIQKLTVIIDGKIQDSHELPIRFVKVEKDYSADIFGMWEGHSTGAESSEFDDGENHRWEYLLDGTFNYFRKVDGQWQISDDDYADYFVAGNLLCTRWKNAGEGNEEHREWWEIESIENGVMKWKALRQKEDGSTYTATFEMKKVTE